MMVLGQKEGLCHIPALGLTCLSKSSSQNIQKKGAASPSPAAREGNAEKLGYANTAAVVGACSI